MPCKDYPYVGPEYMVATKEAQSRLEAALNVNRECAWIMHAVGILSSEKHFNLCLGVDLDDAYFDMADDMLIVPIKRQFPNLSNADLYELAGQMAVSVAGGPKLHFHPGRKDEDEPEPPYGAKGSDDHAKNKDFTVQDMIALSGARCLERPKWNEGVRFDNSYFKDLLSNDKRHLLINADNRDLVEKYAADENAFFEDYKEARNKLSNLWFPNCSADEALRKRLGKAFNKRW